MILYASMAFAGGCGDLVAAPSAVEMVWQLRSRHLYITFEGERPQTPVRFRLPPDATALEAAQRTVAACEPCQGYDVATVADRVEIRQNDAPPLLFDAVVDMPPGERSFQDFAAELQALLADSESARQMPIGRIQAVTHPRRQISVPDLGPVPARELLAKVQVLHAYMSVGGQMVSQHERVAWDVAHLPMGQGVGLFIIDLEVPDEPPEPTPGFETRSIALERIREEWIANPAPGQTSEELAELVARLDAEIATARAFEAEAAAPCDP